MCQLDDFIDFCVELGIDRDYFDETCYISCLSRCEFFDNFNHTFRYGINEIENFISEFDKINKESLVEKMDEIKNFVKSELIDPKIVDYFDNFNVYDAVQIGEYYDQNLSNLNYDYNSNDDVDTIENKIKNWKVVYIALGLLNGLGFYEYNDAYNAYHKKKYEVSRGYYNSKDNSTKEYYTKLYNIMIKKN